MTDLGLHDLSERGLGIDRVSWMVDVVYTGHNPAQRGGPDYRWWRDRDIAVVCRLDDGQGTIPTPQYYDAFAQRCANVIADSQGCDWWVIGNEFGNAIERPPGAIITAADYIACYRKVWAAVKAVRPEARLAPAALGPWNTETGDWLGMYRAVLEAVEADWLCWHVYSHGYDPALVTSDAKMDPPYQDRHYHFRVHQDWAAWTPESKRGLPVIVTEANGNGPWETTGWIQAAYDEIRRSEMDVKALCFFRANQCGDGWALSEGAWGELERVEEEVPVADNLLINGSFEGSYLPWQGINELHVAPSWAPWYSEGKNYIPGLNGGGFETNPTRRAEWNKAAITLDPYRVRLGNAAQHWFSYSGTSYGGVLQQVPIILGNTYRASVWAQAWCGDKDSDPHSCKPDIAYISLGIDPDGGDWYGSRAILWTQWAMLNAGYQQVQSVPVVARAARVTVYISVCFKYAATHNDVYLDDAALVQVEGAVVPPPEPEPEPPPVGADVDYDEMEKRFLKALAVWDRR